MACSVVASILLLATSLAQCCMACTYFELNTTLPGKEVVIGRTMEFAKVFSWTDWQVTVHPRGSVFNFSNASGLSEYSGEARYAHVSIDFNAPARFAADGMNEEGLSVAVLIQHRAEYQHWDFLAPPAGKKRLLTGSLIRWALANFATAKEVKEALQSGEYVVSHWPLPKALGAHWAIADAQGGSIVVEFERGELKVYDNAVGVLTNDPFYPWHVQNLNTYTWLSPNENQNEIVEPLQVNTGELLAGQQVVPSNPSYGINLGGLPSDTSPQSRFVKVFYLRQISLHNSPPGDTLPRWLALAQGLLNSVFIPLGTEGPDRSPQLTSGHTSYASLRVPQSGFYAFRTYDNMEWHIIDLKKLDLTRPARLPLPRFSQLAMRDVSAEFQPLTPEEVAQPDWSPRWPSQLGLRGRRL